MRIIAVLSVLVFLSACDSQEESQKKIETTNTSKEIALKITEKKILIDTPKGKFNVWTKSVGDSPTKRVLLLHGGPGGTHEFFECFEDHMPQEGIEFIYYDQLGSHFSDQPSDTSLWTIERFVDEVEQVRVALGLNKDNFYLYGQSWGGILAAEYALKHQDKMKGLIISNMVMDIQDYCDYAKEVLGPQMPAGVFEEIMAIEAEEDYSNPRYMELLTKHHYSEHIMRKPEAEWPDAVKRAFEHLNPEVYVFMQGHSEFGITAGATLIGWSVKDRLPELSVPTLSIGAQHDSMDPEHMKWIATQVHHGRSLHCPDGSHLCQYDDPKHFFPGLISFIHDVDQGSFN